MVWLFFEALNLPALQWKYHSRIREPWQLVPLGLASFSTVIPIILEHVIHLFQMPIPGYVGLIPFALSILVVYHWQQRFTPGLLTAMALYALSTAGLYALTVLYAGHGLWVFYGKGRAEPKLRPE